MINKTNTLPKAKPLYFTAVLPNVRARSMASSAVGILVELEKFTQT